MASSEWECPNCPWVQKAHPSYGWSKSDDRAVKVHQTMLCPNKPCPHEDTGMEPDATSGPVSTRLVCYNCGATLKGIT